jgi:putative tricarboxylic transport membrane protein
LINFGPIASVAEFRRRVLRKRDFYAGGLMVLFGLGVALRGPAYGLGSLTHMGPGFMPTALGVILVALGIMIAASGVRATAGPDERVLPNEPQWLAWLCILAGPSLFILCGSFGGLVPAIFSCVFVSALGDRSASWKSALGLAIIVTLFGVALFSLLLGIPMPLLAWRGP